MSEFEDAKKCIGQVRLWVMGYGLGIEEVTCFKVSGHVAYDGKSESVTQLSIWCEYVGIRGEKREVWFAPSQFEKMEVKS